MKIEKVGFEKVDEFVRIYNSAIRLFPENQRADSSPVVFKGQFNREVNLLGSVEIDGIHNYVAFASFQDFGNGVVELGSLYVHKDFHRKGFGKEMLEYVESLFPKGSLLYAKVLNNAPWSVKFYENMNLSFADENILLRLGTEENGWEKVMWKEL